ncbi:MAG: TetR/AcrR family transcriptional regulator [Candidatus Cloacimonadaceae bacterium]|nr:TetR/AcrR family transcriptional regulator [Candidatus Cloacimonadaceae bacterium]MDP3114879.1 TetR/AcrR family transcriptional regulator [Candidatus Cloacimonadaceae bacterium]
MEVTKRQMDIVEAAISIIANQGYRELTTKNLAQHIGVTEAALYRHFVSKNALISKILDYFEQVSQDVIQKINRSQASPYERVRMFVMNRFQLFISDRDLAKVMFSEELFKSNPTHAEHMQKIMHIHRSEVMGFLIEAQIKGEVDPALDPQQIFRIIVGAMRLTITQWNLSNYAFDLMEEGDKLMNTIKHMIEVRK